MNIPRIISFISEILRVVWLYLPSLAFPIMAAFSLTQMPQGFDLLTVNAEGDWYPTIFITSLVFWAAVAWYTSRLLYYAVLKYKYKIDPDAIPDPREICMSNNFYRSRFTCNFFYHFPRLINYTVFIAMESALISHYMFPAKNHSLAVLIDVLVGYGLYYIIAKVGTKPGSVFSRISRWYYYIAYGILVLISLFHLGMKQTETVFFFTFCLVATAKLIFLCYIISRRFDLVKNQMGGEKVQRIPPRWFRKVMEIFTVPMPERRSFLLFLVIYGFGLIMYVLAFTTVHISRGIGPLSFVMVAFGILTSVFNLLNYFNTRYTINLQVLLIIWAVIAGYILPKPYQLRLLEAPRESVFEERPDLKKTFDYWVMRNDSALTHSQEVPMFFVVADGGASRSAFWTSGLLGRIEEKTNHQFHRNLFAISGASGGSIGNVVYYSMLYEQMINHNSGFSFAEKSDAFLRSDFLSFPLAHFIGPDFFRHVVPIEMKDRAAALEESMQQPEGGEFIGRIMSKPISSFLVDSNVYKNFPVLYINTTRVQDGSPGVISSVTIRKPCISSRLDVLTLLDDFRVNGHCMDMRLVTAAVMSARFPYMSPAGCIGGHCFVDGGYFDNSGAGIIHETMLELELIMRKRQLENPALAEKYKKIKFYVVHFRNSPYPNPTFKAMHPITNDLLAPILALVGSFTGQTEVNNDRLKLFITNREQDKRLRWMEFSLYEDKMTDTSARYNMNWVISDEHLNQISHRMKDKSIVEKMDSIHMLIKGVPVIKIPDTLSMIPLMQNENKPAPQTQK